MTSAVGACHVNRFLLSSRQNVVGWLARSVYPVGVARCSFVVHLFVRSVVWLLSSFAPNNSALDLVSEFSVKNFLVRRFSTVDRLANSKLPKWRRQPPRLTRRVIHNTKTVSLPPRPALAPVKVTVKVTVTVRATERIMAAVVVKRTMTRKRVAHRSGTDLARVRCRNSQRAAGYPAFCRLGN